MHLKITCQIKGAKKFETYSRTTCFHFPGACKICGIGNASEDDVRRHMWGTHKQGCKEICNTFWDDVWSCHESWRFCPRRLAWLTAVINAHATFMQKRNKSPPSSICGWTLFHALKCFPNCKQFSRYFAPFFQQKTKSALALGRHNDHKIRIQWQQLLSELQYDI